MNSTIRRNLILILFVALILRVIALDSRTLWYDEAFAVLYAERSYADMVYGTVTAIEGAGAADVHPLLYYFLLHNWMQWAGHSVYAVRYLSVLLNIVGLSALYSLVSRWLERRTGLTAVAVAAAMPFIVHYAQEVRMYALMATLALLASSALLHRRLILYAFCAALTVYAHNLGALYLAVLNLALLYKVHNSRQRYAILLANIGALALFLPWMVLVLPGQIGFVGRGYWIQRPTLAELFRTLIAMTFNLPLPAWAIAPALTVALLILVLTVYRAIKLRSQAVWLLVLAWGPVMFSFVISQWRPIYLERSFLPGVVVYCGAVGWLITHGGLPRFLHYGVILASMCLMGVGLQYHYTFREYPNSDFPELQRQLRNQVQAGDLIVHDNKMSFFPAYYYDRTLPQVFLPDPSGPADTLALPTQDALSLHSTPLASTLDATRLWYITVDEAILSAQAAGLANTYNWLQFAEYCQLANDGWTPDHVGDLVIYRFEACQKQ